jgi:hypothetical protein
MSHRLTHKRPCSARRGRLVPIVVLVTLLLTGAATALTQEGSANSTREVFLPLAMAGASRAEPTPATTPSPPAGTTPNPTAVVTPSPTAGVPPAPPADGNEWLIGQWEYYASSGGLAMGILLELREDGTFTKVVASVVGDSYYASAFEGKYRISGDKLISYERLKSTATASSWEELLRVAFTSVKDVPVEDTEETFGRSGDDGLLIETTEYERSQ